MLTVGLLGDRNSIDAGANNIEIKLVNHGLSTVQVRTPFRYVQYLYSYDSNKVKDDGHGIAPEDRAVFARQHYTSKITSFEDLEKLFTLGFRGEALNAICCVAEKFELVTKTSQDTIAKYIQVDSAGAVFRCASFARFLTFTCLLTIDQIANARLALFRDLE